MQWPEGAKNSKALPRDCSLALARKATIRQAPGPRATIQVSRTVTVRQGGSERMHVSMTFYDKRDDAMFRRLGNKVISNDGPEQVPSQA